MRITNVKRMLGVLAATALASGALSAATISGQFNVTGNVLVNTTEDVFGNMVVGDQQGVTQIQLTGSFADLAPGQTATTLNLVGPSNVPPGPVTPGTPFSLPNYIVLPNGINLDLQNIALTNSSVCSSTYTGPCVAYVGSPIVLSEVGSSTIASFTGSGVAHTAGMTDYAPFVGIYTSQFANETPIQVVDSFLANGYIVNSYSANFMVTPSSTTPEPASMALLGAGLFGLGILGKRKLVK